jgi:putative transposase
MAHSLRRVWIHGVFSTKNRIQFISKDIEAKLYSHIVTYLQEKFNSPVEAINGTEDHVHVLFLMNSSSSVAEIFKGIKGESAHWINEQSLVKGAFEWSVGYGAFSVSETAVLRVKSYILHQKAHHKTMDFMDEMKNIEKQFCFKI